MTARRSDTKQRIQQVALELFTAQGYDGTSLREIAERLEITKAALYYHFRSKEDIVTALVADMTETLEEVLAWAAELRSTPQGRGEIVRRVQSVTQAWQPMLAFVQANSAALHDHPNAEDIGKCMLSLVTLLSGPTESAENQLRSVLAMAALLISTAPIEVISADPEELRAASLKLALELAQSQSA